MSDLFGNPDEPAATIKHPVNGYAMKPGGGPDGETCGSCRRAVKVDSGARAYWKCGAIKHRWTNGPGTDIRLKSPSCSLWEANP